MSGKIGRLAAVMAGIMLLAAFMSGCGAADVGAVKMYMEAADLKSYVVSGDVDMEVNPYAMDYYYYDDYEKSSVRVKLNISGEVVNNRFDDLYLNLKIKYGINSNNMGHEANLRLFNNVLYMPVGDYIDLYIETACKLENGYSDKMCESLRSAFLKAAGDHDYVILGDTSELYQWAAFSGLSMYYDETMAEEKKAEDLIFNSVTSMFSGFETGFAKSVPGGFAIEVTPEKAVDFYENLIKYISDNKSRIAKAAAKLYQDLYGADEVFAGYAPTEEDILYGLDDIGYYSLSDWDKEYAKLLFKGSGLNASITKQGGAYAGNADLKLNYRGENMMTLKGSLTQTIKTDIAQATVPTLNPVSEEEITAMIDKTEREINYAKKMEISWRNWSYYPDDNTLWTNVNIEFAEGSASSYFDCLNEAGTVYLPMRETLEWFNEEVGWDGADKKAYVARGDQRIYLEGQQQYGVTYVKARELEKLGYKVNYTYEKDDWGYGSHLITITR